MGWLWLAVIGVGALAALWLARLPRMLWSFVAAGLLLGATGYAMQQKATLPGTPVAPDSQGVAIEPGMVAFRAAIMPGAPGDAAILAAADDQLRAGEKGAAVQRLLDAVAASPRDAALWTGLGDALVVHDGGRMSPTAQFAFRRALQLAPNDPGPAFFLGMAHAQSGDFPAAKLAWQRALDLTPKDAPYREDIVRSLGLLDQSQALDGAPPPAP